MYKSAVLGLAGLLAVAAAQNSITSAPSPSATGASSSSSSAPPKTHTIQVGQGGFRFTPDEIKDVAKGDTVTFEFYPPDHSVARAEFGSACVPYENSGKGKVGFFSEQKNFTDVNEVGKHNWNLLINDTEPIFFYCTAPESCIKKLMVGVINPTEEKTLQKQLDSARTADYQLAPGDPIPSEQGHGEESSSVPPGTSPTSAAPSNDHHSNSHKLSTGAIAGIVVGGVAFIAICAALFFYVGRTKSLKEAITRNDATVKHTSMAPGGVGGADAYGNAPGTPGYMPASPFSPSQSVAEYGVPPTYSPGQPQMDQANKPAGVGQWGAAPSPHQGHMSMAGQPGMTEHKPHTHYAEMPSPDPNQQSFTAELEAPIKSPR